MPEVWVQSLAGEIRPHTLCTQAWPKIKIKESNTLFSYTSQGTPYSWIELFFYSLACVSCEVALSCQLMLDFVFHVLGGLTVFRTLCPSVKHIWISLVAQTIKCLPAMRETWVWFLGWEDPLEGEMAIHSSTLAWKIPWMEECGRLQSMGSQRVGHNWVTSLHPHWNFYPHYSVYPISPSSPYGDFLPSLPTCIFILRLALECLINIKLLPSLSPPSLFPCPLYNPWPPGSLYYDLIHMAPLPRGLFLLYCHTPTHCHYSKHYKLPLPRLCLDIRWQYSPHILGAVYCTKYCDFDCFRVGRTGKCMKAPILRHPKVCR